MFGEVRLGDIVQNIESQDWRLFLCKPDYTVIAPIKDVTDLSWNIRAGKVDEMSFTIPAQVDIDHGVATNPLIKKIKHRYLFKLIYNNRETYLIFSEDDKSYSNDESVSFKAYGLGYMLRDKTIRDWSATSKNIQYMLDEVLQETNWKVGFVDADINSKYRSHEVSNNNVLEIVYELAEKFGGLIVWDTVNKVINIYKPENVGKDKGFRLREGKYLESFNQNTNSDDVVTRLKVYGKDGLTFRRLSPTGSNYIEDFSWFLYPFEQDEQGRVIKHSNYMSDGLASGIVEYQNHLASIQGNFESLTTQLTSKQDEIKQREQELSILLTDLKVIMDELDVYNSTKSGNVSDITSRRNAKQAQIDSKTSQITTLQNQEKSIQSQLDSLRTNVQMSNFLTPEQMLELNDYIITKDYTNDSIVDEEDLLADGIEAFKTFRQPKVNLNIDIVNFLKNLESQNDWDKLGLGDTIYIKNSRLDVDISAKITEIQFNLTGEDINLTLANEHEILDSDELFLKKIYDAANTSTSVNMNQWKWDLVEETNSLVHRLLTEGLNAAERAITAGYKQNISISERGIIIRSDQEPHKWIVMQNGVIGLTNNNGNSWEVAITPDGVYAQTLIGKIIMGSRLIIEDEDGIIRLSGSKQEIFDAAGNQKVVLGEYETDKYGLKIYNGAIEIVNGLPENQIDPKATEKWNSAEQNAKDYAKEYADELKTSIDNEITDVRDALGGFNEEVNTTFKDGVISEAEAKSIETYINILTTEKADVDRRYTAIYNDASLTDSAVKSTLSTAKTNYNTSHNNLIEAVQNAIADDATTEAEKMNVDSKFSDYRDKLSALTQQIEIAIRSIETAKANSAESEANKYTDSKLRDYVTATLYEQDIAEIQSQIDGSITTWFYPYEPTLTNAPAKEWATNDQKNVHLGDIFYNDSNGYAYRFALKDGAYQWLRITDSDVTKALRDASNAQDTADSKRRVFVTQPTPPYDIGDLWTQGPGGEIFRCIKSRQSGSYSSADWDKASKYTDDTRAIKAEENAIAHANQLKESIDGEIEGLETALGELNTTITTTFRDGVISEAEARSIEKYINIVNSEKADVDARYNTIYGDSELDGTAKTNLSSKKTAYNTAHTNLINSINTAIADYKTTTAEKTDVDSKFTAYRTALSALSIAFEDAIDVIAQAKATKALEDANTFTQGKIDVVNRDIEDVSGKLDGLETEIKGTFKDGLIDEAEAKAIAKYINTLTAEKGDLDSRYTSLYSDVNLAGTAKTNLQSAKNAYNTAHTSLINSISTAIEDGKTTSAESADVDAKFTAYRTALNTLATRLEEAIKAISTKNASDAESRANSYTDGKIQTVNQQIGELNDAVGTLEDDLNTMLEDGVLGAEERARLNALLDVLAIEKADVDEQYSAVYADANIPPANQTALQTTKTALNTSHDSLIATINTALSDNLISDAEKTSINTAFTDYKEKLTTFSQTVNTAILAIAQNVGEKVDTKLRKYADDSSGAVRNDLRLVAPLPNNITMDASGITASTASSSSFAALDYRGLYVQGGAFDLRTGSASNRGVKIDGSGIHAYNSSGVRTFYVDTNGNLNASRGTFSGSITGATGTFYGDLYAAGGTFTGTLNGANGTFTGTVSAGKISGGTVEGATISSGDSSANGITTINYGKVTNYKTFSGGQSGRLEITEGSMTSSYLSDYSGTDWTGRYGYNSVVFHSSSEGQTTTFHHNGITATRTRYFTIDAAVQFRGSINFLSGVSSINFSGATVTGLDLTAKFG